MYKIAFSSPEVKALANASSSWSPYKDWAVNMLDVFIKLSDNNDLVKRFNDLYKSCEQNEKGARESAPLAIAYMGCVQALFKVAVKDLYMKRVPLPTRAVSGDGENGGIPFL